MMSQKFSISLLKLQGIVGLRQGSEISTIFPCVSLIVVPRIATLIHSRINVTIRIRRYAGGKPHRNALKRV